MAVAGAATAGAAVGGAVGAGSVPPTLVGAAPAGPNGAPPGPTGATSAPTGALPGPATAAGAPPGGATPTGAASPTGLQPAGATAPTGQPAASSGTAQPARHTAGSTSGAVPTAAQPHQAGAPAPASSTADGQGRPSNAPANASSGTAHGRSDQLVLPHVDTPLSRRSRPAGAAQDSGLAARYAHLVGAEPPPLGADPADQAAPWSRCDDYPGGDRWRTETLPAGTLVVAAGWLLPEGREVEGGGSGFVLPAGSVAEFGDAAGLFESCQVAPQYVDGRWQYPATLSAYRLGEPLDVGACTAVANPHWGTGGGTQYFVPDFRALVLAGVIEYAGSTALADRHARIDADRVRAGLRARRTVVM